MNITKAINAVVSASFQYDAETVNIKIKRGKLNLKTMRQLENVSKDSQLLAPVMVELLESWDLTTDDKTPFELSEDNISILPQDFLGELTKCVIESATANPPKAS
jgi:hypothetical protein